MTDRDLGGRPKAPLALRLGSAGAVGLAFLTWACGGAKGSSNHEFTPTPNNPSPTATEMLPTATLPEATATVESIPAASEIVTPISQGFVGIDISPQQIPDNAYRDSEQIIKMLNNCYADGPITVTVFQGTVPVEVTVEKSDPNYRSDVLGACERVGDATKQLYQVTQREEFFQANQLMKRAHRAKFLQFSREDSRIDESYWTTVESNFYTLTPAK